MDEQKRTILLVEDEVIIAMTEKMQLENAGYHVLHVGTGETAVATVCDDSQPVDLILMDIDLGSGIDGTVAAERILEHKDIPLIFLSSHTEPEIVEKTEKITSYGYIVKNSGFTVLDASIKMAFRLFHSRKVLKEKERALSYQHDFMGYVIEHNRSAIAVHDKDLRYIYVSKRYLETFRVKDHNVIGKHHYEVFPDLP
jgi:CheY-like chemotaxis protein